MEQLERRISALELRNSLLEEQLLAREADADLGGRLERLNASVAKRETVVDEKLESLHSLVEAVEAKTLKRVSETTTELTNNLTAIFASHEKLEELRSLGEKAQAELTQDITNLKEEVDTWLWR